MNRSPVTLLAVLTMAAPLACGRPPEAPPSSSAPASSPSSPASLAVTKRLPLPGVTPPTSFDYLASDRARGLVWVPVGNTGSVDRVDVRTQTITRVDGFATAERDVRGTKRVIGPSAVTVGDGVVYVGDRATHEVCVVDAVSATKGACFTVPVAIDGLQYVASTKEVWVTAPDAHALVVLDAANAQTLTAKTTVTTDGEVEGFGVDEGRGLFFTNLEDKGGTVVVDLKTHAVKGAWNPGCGSEGPRGLAVDAARGFVMVACTDHVQVLDVAHAGAPLGRVDVAEGIDNLDYDAASGRLYVAAGRAGVLAIVHVDDAGAPRVVASGPTAKGARNAVADASGTAYVVDPQAAALLVVAPPR